MGEGVLYNFVFTEFPFKTVSGDVTAFHRIIIELQSSKLIILDFTKGPKITNSQKSKHAKITRSTVFV